MSRKKTNISSINKIFFLNKSGWFTMFMITYLSIFHHSVMIVYLLVYLCNLAVDYITPLWVFNYSCDRPGNSTHRCKLGSAFWLCRPAVNQFDFGCLSELTCIYTELKQVGVCSLREVCWPSLTRPRQLRHANSRRMLIGNYNTVIS